MRMVMDARSCEPNGFEQSRESFGKREWSGEQFIPGYGSSRIDTRRCIPKESLINEAAAEIPNRCDHRSAPYGYPLNFVQGGDGIGDKIENELGRSTTKGCIRVRQPDNIRHLKVEIDEICLRAREGNIRRCDIDADDIMSGPSRCHRVRKASGAAANIQKGTCNCKSREIEQRLCKPPRPAPKKNLVGSPVGRVVG
jgi:hypothetical protein